MKGSHLDRPAGGWIILAYFDPLLLSGILEQEIHENPYFVATAFDRL